MKRSVILYIAMSLDGYIAQPNDDLSFLSIVEQEGEDYGYFDFIKTVDTVILGRRTYDWVMNQVQEFPHADKETYVITRKSIQQIGNTIFYNESLKTLIHKLKEKSGKNIFIDGGAQIVNELLKDKLIDEIIISIIPILTGNGIMLFNEGNPEQNLELVSSKRYEKGLIQVHYKVVKH